MNLNYAIFRSEPIMTMSDLKQIGSHNNREKQAYNSNPDIKLELCKDNIELIPINTTYTKGFKEITKEYEKELEEIDNKIHKLYENIGEEVSVISKMEESYIERRNK